VPRFEAAFVRTFTSPVCQTTESSCRFITTTAESSHTI
jgi:hypothetical protein